MVETATPTPAPVKTVEELLAAIATAATSGDMVTLLTLNKELAKRHAEIAAAETAKYAEARKTATERIMVEVKKAHTKLFTRKVNGVETDMVEPMLSELKATGYSATFSLKDGWTVALAVPSSKIPRAGGTGGAPGKMKAAYGKSLQEIFAEVATDTEKAELEAAASNSAKWAVKDRVVKKAIADGKVIPIAAA